MRSTFRPSVKTRDVLLIVRVAMLQKALRRVVQPLQIDHGTRCVGNDILKRAAEQNKDQSSQCEEREAIPSSVAQWRFLFLGAAFPTGSRTDCRQAEIPSERTKISGCLPKRAG